MIKNSIVLVGAGNAHLQLVRKWAMSPLPQAELLLVNENPRVPYSGMVPGYLSGQYKREQIEIDLTALCGVSGVTLVPAKARRLDTQARQLLLEGRPALSYDVLSLNVGSRPLLPPGADLPLHSIPVKPLHRLLEKVLELDRWLESHHGNGSLVVVGSGAGGTEVALAVKKRLVRHRGLRLTIVEAASRLLPQYPPAVGRAFERTLSESQIAFKTNARVVRASETHLDLESGERLEANAVLWTTQAEPNALVQASGLKVDKRGFMLVHDTLQSFTDPCVFGAGDCVSLESYLDLPKAGVYAVRQGPVLWRNLKAHLDGKPLSAYKPQRRSLTILNSSDEKAVLSYGTVSARGAWVWKLKQAIDARWMRKFQQLDTLRMAPETPMRCGGCGSKIPGEVLHGALRKLEIPDHPAVLMGCRDKEDASVTRLGEQVEVHSVDFFKAFLPDPFLFGRIAAQNALSDLFAMNARPVHAQAIVTLPLAKAAIQEEQLFQMLSGAILSLKGAGATLSGGHTSEAMELALGFSVVGTADENKLFRKTAVEPNQKLILTQPLGSGALLAAISQGSCRSTWYDSLIYWMLCSNQGAAKVFDEFGLRACTDITGFGLAGHLFEMLEGTGLSARLYAHDIPRLAGFSEVTSAGIFSSLHEENAKWARRVSESLHDPVLFDPQTSGGLLGAVAAEHAFEVLTNLKNCGYHEAAIIGEVIEADGESRLC